ncbi:Extracellular triacylglycerol lipase precursor [Rhizoctonia solani]|uniref:Carboxylic ester hydrolase n=1 Tax=Rhizoctonia solani TaxID=456999 RepID=A0A8H7H5U9_9AGAM|nr:Extracellular triacylglycerol lipase precursor [Rhizoctonia solani]
MYLLQPLILFVTYVSAVSVPITIQGANGVSYLGAFDETLNQDIFQGVPFGQPPVGSLRFKPPVAWAPKSAPVTLNATALGPSCHQGTSTILFVSEDCLTINIRRVHNSTSSSRLPVMVWIYGGGFYNGDVTEYTGRLLLPKAASLGNPVVYVSFNYRLGVFGFPPGIASASAGAQNLGLYDQRLALEWVNKNIAYFGGDPAKVRIFGESAGAISVSYQTMYNGGNIGGLFHGAIIQSGSPSSRNTPAPSNAAREIAYEFIVNATGCADSCDTFECIRYAPISQLSQANRDVLKISSELHSLDQGPVAFGPTVVPGDSFLPEKPADIIHDGRFADVPIINGVQFDEGTAFSGNTSTTQDVIGWLTSTRPGLTFGISDDAAIRQLLAYYPDDPTLGSPYGSGSELFGRPQQYKRLSSIVGDLLFQSAHRDHLRTATKFGVNSWSYTFTQFIPTTLPPYFAAQYGVRHAGETLFVFQNLPINAPPEMTRLADTVTNYWTSFAYNLDPNPIGSRKEVYWPKYGANATSLSLQGGNVTLMKDDYRQAQIEFIIGNPSLYN